MTDITYISQPPRRYTFETIHVANWIRNKTQKGNVLNLFSGKSCLYDYIHEIKETRVDINEKVNPDYLMDANNFLDLAIKEEFKYNTIILDPPYTYRKSMEKYEGRSISNFQRVKEKIPQIILPNGNVITCGYHSVVMGKSRGFEVKDILLISHGGAHHDTIITNEVLINVY